MRRPALIPTALAGLLAAASPAAVAAPAVPRSAPAVRSAAPPAPQDGLGSPQLFAIPETRDARALADSAEAHVRARRWLEAVLELQRLMTDHRGDVLPARWDQRDGESSIYAFHTGAASWATRRIAELPPRAREIYRQRFAKPAQRAYAAARESGDRRKRLGDEADRPHRIRYKRLDA